MPACMAVSMTVSWRLASAAPLQSVRSCAALPRKSRASDRGTAVDLARLGNSVLSSCRFEDRLPLLDMLPQPRTTGPASTHPFEWSGTDDRVEPVAVAHANGLIKFSQGFLDLFHPTGGTDDCQIDVAVLSHVPPDCTAEQVGGGNRSHPSLQLLAQERLQLVESTSLPLEQVDEPWGHDVASIQLVEVTDDRSSNVYDPKLTQMLQDKRGRRMGYGGSPRRLPCGNLESFWELFHGSEYAQMAAVPQHVVECPMEPHGRKSCHMVHFIANWCVSLPGGHTDR
jgi:hypothetical protein